MSCTVYPQGDQCCADAPSLIALQDHPLHHLQHVLHRPIPSHLVLPHNSPLLSSILLITSHCLVCLVTLSTSTQQYSYLIKLPLAFFITRRRSRFTSLHLPLLISTLALCGDIHSNPGPPVLSSFSLCTYNIRSLLSNDHISVLNDLIETRHPNIIALTETWINKSWTPSELANATPSGYTILSYPHTTKHHISDKTLGSGTAFIILDSISIILNPSQNYKPLNVHLSHLNCLPLHSPFLTSIAHRRHPNTLNPSVSF